jgi:hypothetical protein
VLSQNQWMSHWKMLPWPGGSLGCIEFSCNH